MAAPRIIPAPELAGREWPREADIHCGLGFLQRHFGGWVAGDKICVAGRTNVGKSHLALAMLAAQSAAGVPTLYASLEDPPRRVSRRLRAGYAREGMYTTFPPKTSGGIVSVFREAREEYGVRAFCVDYFQKVRYDGPAQVWSKPDMLDVALSELEECVRALDGVLLLVSQVTRPQQGVDPAEFPRLYEMKESAAIENAAEVVLIIGNVKGRPMVEVAKAKDEPTGVRYAMVRNPRTGVLSEPDGAPQSTGGSDGAGAGDDDEDW